MDFRTFIFVVFVCIFHTSVNGNECTIPEGEELVDYYFINCTTFNMNPNGNYSVLEGLSIAGPYATAEAIYDLLDKLTAAPNLRFIVLRYNSLLKTFDFSKFNPLKNLNELEIHFCENLEPVYTAKENNQKIKSLILYNCALKILDIPFFIRFPMLETIMLLSNKISGLLDLKFLTNFVNLNYFSISQNQITDVINTKKSLIMPKMSKIFLGDNKIKYIDLDIFQSFPNLEKLMLSRNMLSGTFYLDRLSNLKVLASLQIGNNRITKIVNSKKEERPKMSHLFFDKNKLTFLDLDDFKVFTNLEILYLDQNQLTSICGYSNAKTIFQRISKISIEKNDFDCFQLEKMTAPYIGTQFWYDSQEITCPNDKIMFENTTCCYPYKI